MKILHNKLPMSNDGRSCLLSVETQRDLHTYIQESVKDLDEQYVVITTPTDITCLNDNDTVITIDAKSYTLQELKKALNITD